MASTSSSAPAVPVYYRTSLKLQSVPQPQVQEELEEEDDFVNVELHLSRIPEGEGSHNVKVCSKEISIKLIEVKLLRDDNLLWNLRDKLTELGVAVASDQNDIIIDLFKFIYRQFIRPKSFNSLDARVVMNITEEREGPKDSK